MAPPETIHAAFSSVTQRRCLSALLAASVLVVSGCGKPAPSTSLDTGNTVADNTMAASTPDDPLSAAFAAAFPKGATVTVGMNTAGGEAASADDGYPLTFKAKKLVPVSDGLVALVSEGTSDDACHACTGKLHVSYLKQNGDSFTAEDPAVESNLDGDGFGAAPRWKLIKRKEIPALRLTTSYGDQGCSSTSVSVYLLKPEGVVEDKAAAKPGVEKCS